MTGPAPRSPLEARLAGWLDEAIALGLSGPPLLRAMLGLLGDLVVVTLDPAVPTACLSAPEADGAPFRIRLGTGAFAARLRGPEDVLYLLAHELAHFVREDLAASASGLDPHASNLAADALNDAWLHGPAFGGFFDPHTSLRGRETARDPVGAFLMLQASMARELRVATSSLVAPRGSLAVSREWYTTCVEAPPPPHRLLYRPEAWASAHDLVQRGGRDGTLDLVTATELLIPLLEALHLRPWVQPSWPALQAALAGAKPRLRERLAAVRAAGSASSPEAQTGFGLHSTEERLPERVERGRGRLIEVVLRVAFEAGLDRGRGAAPEAVAPSPSGTAMTRRSVTDWKAGARPTPFTRRAPSVRHGRRIQIYVDVSGSMSPWLPRIVGEVSELLEAFLEPDVLAFAADDVQYWFTELLMEPRTFRRGGTSFVPVAEDMRARGVRTAIVISDGCGEWPRAEVLETLARRGARVALVFPEQVLPHPLDAISPQGWRFSLGLSRFDEQ